MYLIVSMIARGVMRYSCSTFKGYPRRSMSIRAMARHDPPTKNNRAGRSGNWVLSAAIRSLIWARTAFLPPLIPISFNGPKSEVSHRPTWPSPNSSASSIDEPPMSQISPCAPGQPNSTPCAASRASSAPSTTTICKPVSAATSARNSGPSAASRTAAVATVTKGDTSIASASAAKRFKAVKARARPSTDSRPVSAKPAPRPQRIFSLKK